MVFIVISVLNGYKAIEGVFRHKEDALKMKAKIDKECYVCEYKVW